MLKPKSYHLSDSSKVYSLVLIIVLFFSTSFMNLQAQAPGKSLNFDGVDDWAPISLTDYYAGNFTIETWIKTTSTAARSNIVSWGGASSVCEFRLASGKLQILCNGATGNGMITSTANVNTGKWTHVALVKYGTTYSLYINGVMDGLGTITYSGYNFTTIVVGGLYYAGAWAWDAFFPGSMDEMRFWNVARSQGDLAANMYSEMSTPVTGLDHYYKFNSSTGTLMQDEVSGGANLTIYNFALTGATSNWVESYAMVLPKTPITSEVTNTGFTASWTAPTTGVVTNYLLDVATDSAFTNLLPSYSAKNVGSVLTTNITGLGIGTTYYWRVRADKTSVTGTGANTAYQTVTTSILPPGNSLSFGGATDYVNTNTPVFAPINGTVANFTMECWIKPNAADNNGSYNAFLGGQIGGGRNPSLWVISNKVHCSEQNGSNIITSTAVLNQDKWNHVAWVKTGSNNVLYVNGMFAGTWTSAATSIIYTNYNIGYVDTYFSGSIDEVRFWSTSLSQSTIQANMYNEISPSSTGLLHYYKFNTASGTGLADAVTTGTSNGTLTNFALTGTTSNWVESYAMVVPTAFTTTNATATSFTANWVAPIVGSVDNYLLDVSTSPSFDTMVSGFNGVNVGLVTNYNVTGLPNNTGNSYYWRVRANKTSVTGTAANPLNGAIAIAATPPGNALSFDGSNDYVGLPDRLTQAVANSNNSAITIEYWFKGSDVRSAVRFNDASSYIIAGWGGTIGTQYHVLSNDGGTSNGLLVGAAVTDGKWHHVAMTWERNTTNGFKSYLDGVLKFFRNSSNTALPNITAYGYLGTQYNIGELMNGSLDEVRIYNIARTQAEIQADMYSTATTSLPAGLLAYYKMDQGTSGGTNTGLNILTDQTSNAFSATMYNFALTGSSSNWVESYAEITPTNLTTSNVTVTGFTANWAASTLGTATSYVIDVATDTAFANLVTNYSAKNVGNVLTTNITGLANGTTYYWRVRADKTSVTGTGNSAAYQTTTTVYQKPGQALNFDGSNDYVGIGTGASIIGSNAFAVEAWVKTTSTARGVILQQRDGTGVAGEYTFEVLADGTIYWALYNTAWVSVSSVKKVNDGRWHHVAATRESNNSLRIYIDGNLAANAPQISQPLTAFYVAIGKDYRDNAGFFNGNIDEVRIWNTARTQAQLQASMYDEISPSTTGLVHYYSFNSTSGTTLTDAVTTGTANGTLTNFAGGTSATSNWVESYAMVVPTTYTSTNGTTTGFAANWVAPAIGTVESYKLDVSTSANFDTFVSGFNGLDVGLVTSYAVTGLNNASNSYYWRVRANKTSVDLQGANPTVGILGIAATPPANALSFDGSNDYVYLPDRLTSSMANSNNSAITIEYWFKGSNIQSAVRLQDGNGYVIAGYGGTLGQQQHVLSNDGGSGAGVAVGAAATDGKWHHVAMTWQQNTANGFKSYLDGQLQQQRASSNTPLPNVTAYGYLGILSNGGEIMNGSLDEVRMYNVARSQAEIQADMFSTATTNLPSGLLAYYKMDQGTAGGTNTGLSTLFDQTSNANSATMYNFALTGTTGNWVESYAMVVPTAPITSAITNASFTASWTAPTIGVVTNYLLDVATDAAFTSMVTGFNAKNIGIITTYNVTGLEQGTTFYWRVRADKTSVTGQGGNTAVQTVATPQEALNVSSTTATNTFNLLTNAAAIVDPNIAINYTHNITGFSVVLSNGKQNGDVLSYTGTLPNGIQAVAYNSATGVLSFTGTTTPANWQTLLRTVTFRAYNNATVNRSISFSAGSLNSYTNGHYYELVTTPSSWTNSKAAAANKKYLNYTGYLATVITQDENNYIKQILTANAWMGATDEFSQINKATGTATYANQTASEGKWHWVTGPEAGTQFASSNTPAASFSDRFNNWYANEPNNSSGTEHYGQFYSTNNGTWNDLPDNGNIGYVVEYGGMSNDIVQTPSYTLTMSVSATPPGNALSFDGTNDYIYTSTVVSNPTTFTLEAWFNTTASTSGGIVGFNENQTNVIYGSYDRFIWMSADGKINFSTFSTVRNTITSAIAYNDGKYHHVAGSFSTATGMKLYIDGVLIGINATSSITSYSGYWKIGGFRDWANSGAMDYFNGKIDEVRIWSTVRTLAEIQTNMLNVIAPTTAGLSYYYNFDQGTPSGTNTGNTTLYDQTTNANNGTMSGFALSNASSNWVESYAMVVPKPTTTTAITASGFTANWSASTIGTADNYLLDVSTNAGFTSLVTGYNAKNVGTATSFAVTGLTYNTTYYWRVRADKTSVTGQGAYSTSQTVLTAKEPINVTSSTTATTFNLLSNAAIIVDPNLTVNYSQNIDGFRVIINTNKQDGDVLAYTGTVPSGITPVAYDPVKGVLAFTGTTSAANWQTFLRTITFRAYKNSTVARSISFSAGSLNSFSNGHFYDLVTAAPDSWTNSKTAAAAKTYLNYTGYLATVTSQDENDFIKQILSANAWMGASDEFSQINAATTPPTTYANQAASEGKWYWVTGPEAGTQFWEGNGSGSAIAGKYTNWYATSSEPNNAFQTEHYGQFYSTNNGTWNDLSLAGPLGYVVEYGGLSTDIVQTPSYSVTMNVTTTEPGNALNFDGANTYVNIPDANSLDLTTNYTIEAWIKPEAFTFLGGIVDKYQSDNSKGYSLRLTGNSPYSGIGFDEMNTANGILTTNKWYHIAAVNNGGTRTLYVNGVSVPLTGTATTVLANADPVRIGCDFSTRFFNGNIDEVRIWNVARSQAQIVANMNGFIAPTTANLVSYYNFNEGITNGTNTGLTSLKDQTTTLNNGTLNNFGLTSTTTNWVESYAMVVPTTTAATSKYSLGFTANWTASTLGTTEKYYLDVATDAAFTSLVSGYSNKDVGTVTSYDVNTGLAANTTYYYRVRAEKASVTGTGANSNATSVTTSVAETLVATAPSDRTSTSFTANWSAPAIHTISAYLLDVSTVSDFATFVSGYNGLSVSGLYQSITGLTPNTDYYYRVRATSYTNSNTITTSTTAPFATITTSAASICVDGTTPTITFTGSGSNAPYTFIYTINGGTDHTISTTSGDSVTLSAPTSTAGVFTYSLVSVTDVNAGTNEQSGSTDVTVNALPTPTFTIAPSATICSNTDVTYTTQSGQTNYSWIIPGVLDTDYSITSGGIGTSSATVTLKWLTTGSKTVTVNYDNAANCSVATVATTTSTVAVTPNLAAISGTTTTTVGLTTTLSNTTADGVWSSSDATIAGISSTGVVTGIEIGTATISYTLTTGSCTNTATTTYTVNAAPIPTITAVSPTNPVVGTTITVTGTNFSGASLVYVGTYQATFTVVSPTSITFTLPQGTGSSLAVAVTTPGGTATSTSPNLITYNTASLPTITSFTPTSAGTGQTVVITGTNLTNPSSITFGGATVASYTADSSTQITVVIGSGTTGDVVVTTAYPTSATKTGFTYLTCGGSPTIYSGGSLSRCASESPFNITTDANASNYSALTWTTNGTGAFTNNTSADALTTTLYSPSNADSVSGSVILTLTATANSGCLDQTSSKTLTILAASVGGTISGGTSVCTGINNTVLTLEGYTGSITKWQSSTTSDFSDSISDIENTTTSLTATNLTTTTYYRVVITNGICSSVNSATATVMVNAMPTASIVSNNSPICPKTEASFTVSGTSGGVVTYTINGGTATTATLTGGAATITVTSATVSQTLNLVSIIANGCTTTLGTSSTVGFETTTYDGASWSNGLPTSTKAAIFRGNYTINADFNACSIQVADNAVVSVNSGNNVYLYGAITVANGSSFTLNNNTNLLQTDATAVNVGNVVIKRNSSAIVRLDHTLWSSPVSGQNLFSFSPLTLTNRFYTYNTSTNGYVSTGLNASSTFENGKGFAVRAPNNFTAVTPTEWVGTYTGVPNNGSVPFTLSTSGYGYNLVGNPYPSPISAAAFTAANASKINGTIYFYVHSLSMDSNGIFPSGTNYSSWNGTATTVATHIVGDVHLQPLSPTGTIQVGQGFIVKATASGTVNFTNAMRVDSKSNPFLRKSTIEKHRLWLNLATDTGTDINQIAVGYVEGATQEADANFDGLSFGSYGSLLSSKINNQDYVIQGRGLPFDPNDSVPLGFKAATAGNYKIILTDKDGLFSGDQDVFVRDNLMGIDHNVKTAPYTFSSAVGTFDTRFQLVYTKTLATPSTEFVPDAVLVFKKSDGFHVTTKGIIMADIQVFDTTGRLIFEQNNINESATVLKGLTQANQVLLLKITSQENTTVSVKVIN